MTQRRVMLAAGAGLAALNPIAWWRFENNALDSSGNALNGTVVGTASYVAGQVGQAWNSDATRSIQYGNPAALQINSEATGVTLAAWVKPSSFADFRAVMGAGQLEDANGYGLHLSANNYRFQVRVGSAVSVAEAPHSNSTAWAHICGVRSGGVTRLYINAVEVATDTLALGNTTPTSVWRVGASFTALTGIRFHFIGQIDEAAVFNRALSVKEIAQLRDNKKVI